MKWLPVNHPSLGKIIFNYMSMSPTILSLSRVNVNVFTPKRAIVNQRYTCPSSFSNELADLIKKILVIDVSTRLGCMANGNKDIQNHPFFDSVNFVKIYHQTENSNSVPCELIDFFHLMFFDVF